MCLLNCLFVCLCYCHCVVIVLSLSAFPLDDISTNQRRLFPVGGNGVLVFVWAANLTPQSVITKTLLEAQRTHGVETINGVTSICGATCIMFCQLEVLQIWSPGGATCIVVLLGNALATSSTSIELVSSSAEVTSVKS